MSHSAPYGQRVKYHVRVREQELFVLRVGVLQGVADPIGFPKPARLRRRVQEYPDAGEGFCEPVEDGRREVGRVIVHHHGFQIGVFDGGQ